MRQSKRPRPASGTIPLLLAVVSCACARSVEEWQHDLTSRWSDDFHRGMAAIALAEQAPDRAAGAVVPLLAILDGPESPMRPHAADSLQKIAPWAVAEMVDVLVHSALLTEESRIPLEHAILSAGDRAVEPLLDAMQRPGRLGPEEVGVFIVRIGDPAVDPLIGIVRGEDEELAAAAAALLWRIDQTGERSLPALRESLRDPREPVRVAAARSIAHVQIVRASLVEGAERDGILREVVRLGTCVHPSLLEKIASGGPKRARAARECLLASIAIDAARRAAGAVR